MASLDPTTKLKLESILDMSGGYVLDFTNETFADFVRSSLGFDPYKKYTGDLSKARLLRLLWDQEPKASVAKLNLDLLNYWHATLQLAEKSPSEAQQTIWRELVDQFTQEPSISGATAPVSFTTEASVTANKIEIEIHEDIYAHIGQYLAAKDYYHAVEESYKLVREKLRDITGKEKASDVFNNSAQNTAHYQALFGKVAPTTDTEADFFRGIGYLHLGVQHLRNEKAHTPASSLDPNLAIHYIALASLAYDLITRYVSEETIKEIEDLVLAKRHSYRSATAFYNDFENGKWLTTMDLPANIESASVRKVLKKKWLEDADFTRSYDHSNVVLMQLELVAAELTSGEIDQLLDQPTRDSYGNDQEAGMLQFLEFIQQRHPEKVSPRVKRWIEDKNQTMGDN
ncbi:TIGR02391 family protein [Mycolicibacterium goodii]|uniref:TIGR02391 family protein n=1 Tax=Mycolicibacterium goodii TaxID=134601 RepID=UPI001BDBE4DC|nr:TIGR02391 family protein [Mycolicibacterium goodii]MBU8830558.1 TIGR02391 family protein [Mycolicibacterium goodii]